MSGIPRGIARGLVWVAALGIAAWGTLALWFAGPDPPLLRAALAMLVAAAALAVPIWTRTPGRAALRLAIVLATLLLWWSALWPSNHRVWAADVAQTPTAEIDGDRVVVHGVRSFSYRGPDHYTERWETRSYDLDALRGLDLFLSYWGSPSIAHTILSWEFEGGEHLAISIETRKERDEAYSALAGFFRNYELIYVAGDERDLVELRTNHRGEEVYLYRLATPAPRARALLLDYLREMNRLAVEPAWYNALTTNCTTSIFTHALRVAGELPRSWKILANGHLDEWLYERGIVNTALPFPELRSASHINQRARSADGQADFSARIRQRLPARPPPPR